MAFNICGHVRFLVFYLFNVRAMNFLNYLFNATHEDCIWLLDYLKRQEQLCEKGIQEGNWDGYAENLKIRKDNLRNIKANIEIIELKLKDYERSN